MRRYGIDISAWQRNFDIAKARQDYGVEFVIIKAGGGDAGLYTDKYFKRNFNLRFHLLHSYELDFPEIEGELGNLSGKQFKAPLPSYFEAILSRIFK